MSGQKITPFLMFSGRAEAAMNEKLSEGGAVLMPLAAYPFSPKFGWVGDKFGVSWQLSLAKD